MSRNAPVVRWLLSSAVFGGVMFGCAGRVNLPMMWAYIFVYFGLGLFGTLSGHASLDAERRQPGPGAIDLASRPVASFLFLTTVIVASLDAGRFHWTSVISWPVECTAVMVFALASALQAWAIAVNPFFSSAIRIQSERRHQVMTSGPYRLIRHPGYLAMAVLMPATALALGSLVAMIPALLYSAAILWRVPREDQFLRGKLQGYSDYAGRVHHRLVPGLW